MAKARVNLKGFKKAADRLTKDLRNLQKRPALRARRADVNAVHGKLIKIKELIDDCPEGLFRMFEVAEPTTARRAKAKTARKRTRKAR